MLAHRLKPKNDYLFKRIFGEQESKPLLIALLNAILEASGAQPISDVTIIENKELVKEVIDGKSGRLDIRCETERHEQIDIEMQIERVIAMDKRSLFYISKMFVGSIKEGHDYGQLKRTIAINLLDFDFLPASQPIKGLEQGIEQGIERGIEQGIEQGIEKGVKLGAEQTKLETAKNLLALGVEIEKIEKATGLPREKFLNM